MSPVVFQFPSIFKVRSSRQFRLEVRGCYTHAGEAHSLIARFLSERAEFLWNACPDQVSSQVKVDYFDSSGAKQITCHESNVRRNHVQIARFWFGKLGK